MLELPLGIPKQTSIDCDSDSEDTIIHGLGNALYKVRYFVFVIFSEIHTTV